MKDIIQHDQDVETVLEYAFAHKYGYISDLEKLNKPDIIKNLCILGLLKTGYTPKKRTYAITPLGMLYYNVISRQK